MSEIIYLKLVNGEELFAELVSVMQDQLVLNNIMIMETVGEPGEAVKYMFMSRYSSYSPTHQIPIMKDKVIYYTAITDVVETHYRKSVEYAQMIADSKFMEGIADATSYIDMILDKKVKDEPIDEQQFVSDQPSSTKH